jgi:branched-subunit amino acid transport protein
MTCDWYHRFRGTCASIFRTKLSMRRRQQHFPAKCYCLKQSERCHFPDFLRSCLFPAILLGSVQSFLLNRIIPIFTVENQRSKKPACSKCLATYLTYVSLGSFSALKMEVILSSETEILHGAVSQRMATFITTAATTPISTNSAAFCSPQTKYTD